MPESGRPAADDESIDQRVAADMEELKRSLREEGGDDGRVASSQLAGVPSLLRRVNRAAGWCQASDTERDSSAEARGNVGDVDSTSDLSGLAASQIGPYEIEKVIARGGMGIVFRARDRELNRTVALKMMIAGPFADQADRERFRGEAEAAARLDHPGIVPVYDVGQYRGQLYFTMGFIDGHSLATRISDGPMPSREAADLARQIASAVAYAHDNGIVHRDLKPANVLVDVHGQARITDFGLARRADSDSDLTKTGQVLGTPSYMAPEQAAGDGGQVAAASDVYSIGATLYALLTGRPPFQAATPVETIHLVLQQDPVSPRQLIATIPIDLATICLKCLQKGKADRYPSAEALGRDLDRFLRGETVQARMPPLTTRAYRWCRRHPLAATLMAMVCVLAVVGPLLAIEQTRLFHAAETAREEGRRILYISDMNLAMRDWDQANLERCSELLQRHLPKPGETDVRGFEWYYLWRLWQQSQQAPVVFQDERLESMTLSPDRRWLVVGGFDGALILIDLVEGKVNKRWKAHPYCTYAVEVSPDGKWLATASIDNEVSLWEFPSGKPVRTLKGARAISFSPEGWQFAYRTDEESLAILDAPDAEPRVIQDDQDFHVWTLAYSSDGRTLASAGWDGCTRLCDADTGAILQEIPNETEVWTVAWSPDGKVIATGDSKGVVRMCSVAEGTVLHTIAQHSGAVRSLAFTPDSTRLASASDDNTINLMSVASGRTTRSLRGHFASARSLVFSDGGRELWSASIDGNIKRWSLGDSTANDVLDYGTMVSGVALSADGSRVAAIGYDGKVHLWETTSGTLLHKMQAHDGPGWSLEWIGEGDDERLVTLGQDGTVRVWGGELSDTLQRTIPCFSYVGDRVPLAVNRKHGLIAFPDQRFSVEVWDPDSESALCRLQVGTADGISFLPGKRLVVAAADAVFFGDWSTGAVIGPIHGDARSVNNVAVSPFKTQMISGAHDRAVKLWDLDLDSENPLELNRRFKGHSAPVTDVCYSPDGQTFASVGQESIVRLWDVQSGQQLAAFHGHTGNVPDVAFSPDGETIATASDDGTVRLWRAPRDWKPVGDGQRQPIMLLETDRMSSVD